MKELNILLISLFMAAIFSGSAWASTATFTNADMTMTLECPDSVSSGDEFTVKMWVTDTDPEIYFSSQCPSSFAGGVKFDILVNGETDYNAWMGYSFADDVWYSCDTAAGTCSYQNTYVGEAKSSCSTSPWPKRTSFTYDYDLTTPGKLHSFWDGYSGNDGLADFNPVNDAFELSFTAIDFKLGGHSRFGKSITGTCTVNVAPSVSFPPDIDDYIQNLPESCLKKPASNRKNTFHNKLVEVQDLIDAGSYQEAINKLENDIRPKLDGDGENWITCPDAQDDLVEMIDGLVEYLESLL